MSGRKKCPACNGTGFAEPFMDPCRRCAGFGWVLKPVSFAARVSVESEGK